jgi:glycosyltransferase involved in cell wall biosynthesis
MILTESQESIRNLAHAYGLLEDRMLAIRLVPDVAAEGEEPRLGRDPNLAVYPAQFWPHKNHLVLLHAIDLLLRQGRNPRHLVLTGSDKGNEAHVRSHAKGLGVEDHVTFAGFVSVALLRDLYSRATIMVMPSLLGPTNLPPLEALSYGCAVAASQALDAQEISPCGVREVSPFDVPAWADLLDRDIPVPLPDRAAVQQALSARLKSNRVALEGALDRFAQERSLWP